MARSRAAVSTGFALPNIEADCDGGLDFCCDLHMEDGWQAWSRKASMQDCAWTNVKCNINTFSLGRIAQP